jgi:hypothetical protein
VHARLISAELEGRGRFLLGAELPRVAITKRSDAPFRQKRASTVLSIKIPYGPALLQSSLGVYGERRTNQFDTRDKSFKRSRSLSPCHFL